MREIRRSADWFLLIFKKTIIKPGIYLLAGLCILFLFIFDSLVLPGDHPLSYGILNEGAACGEAVLQYLRQDTLYNVKSVSDYQSLKRAVSSGRLDCGFVFTKELDASSGPFIPEKSIIYVCSTSTARGAVLKEKVYAAVLRETTRALLGSVAEEIVLPEEKPDAFFSDIQDFYEEYLNGEETIHVVYETVETDGPASKNNDLLPSGLRRFVAVCGILIFAAAIVYGRMRFSTGFTRLAACLTPKKRHIWRFLEILVPVLFITAVMILCVTVKAAREGCPVSFLPKAAASLLLCGVISSLWSLIYAAFFKKEAFYISSIPILLILCVCTNPELISGINPGTVLKTLAGIFPPAYLSF